MKDRIQINGEWYVKENNTPKTNIKDDDVTFFEGCVYETDNYCWEATRIYKSYADKIFYPSCDIDIEFTDKTQKPFKSEHWDNYIWFNGILSGDDEAYLSALELMGVEGVDHFKAFLKKLVEINYL